MKIPASLLVLPALVFSLGCATYAQGEGASTSHTPKVVGEEVSYEAGGKRFVGYLAYDETLEGKRPGVLVVHEWWGHNAYARRRAEMLAAMGYTALALDMYGEGKQASHPKDAQAFAMEVMADIGAAEERFRAARRLLEAHPTTDPTHTAAIGYCFGGGVVLHMARIGMDLDGVASFHGSLATETPAEPGAVRAAILVEQGGDDPFAPKEQIEALRAEMKAAGADCRIDVYPGVKHSFTNPDATALGEKFGLPLVYDQAADEASWARLEAFLKDVFSR